MTKIDAVPGERSTDPERIVILEDSSTTATTQCAILDFLGHALAKEPIIKRCEC